MRQRHPSFFSRVCVRFIVCAFLLSATVTEGQTPPAMNAGSITLLEEINALAETKGLEVAQCSQKTGDEGMFRLQLSLRAKTHRVFIAFWQALKKTWTVTPVDFSTKLNLDDRISSMPIILDLEAELKAGAAPETTTPFEEMLRLTEDVPFFLGAENQPTGKDIRLLAMKYRKESWPEFQLLAADLQALSDFSASRKGGCAFVSLTPSVISGSDMYSLGLSLAPDGPPLDEFIGLLRVSQLRGTIRDISVKPVKGAQPQVQIQFALPLIRAQELVQFYTIGFSPLVQVVAKPEADGVWNFRATYALMLNRALAPNQLQWPEILKVVSEPWPPILYAGMEFVWQLDCMTVTVDYTEESELALLRPLADKNGFRMRQDNASRPSADRPYRVVLTRAGGTVGDRGEVARPADIDGVPQIGEVISCEDVGGGAVYTIKLNASDLSKFIDGMKPLEHRSIESFTYREHSPGRGEIRISLVRSTLPGAARVYETIQSIIRSPFPWNRTDNDLKTGLRLTSFSIDSTGRVAIGGQTLKSRQIFSDLFPMLERSAGLKDPFFKSGTYRDQAVGRVMTFEVTAWRSL